jgi:hypothetical protein
MTDGKGHGDHGKAERQRDSEQTNPHVGKSGGENSAPAPAEHQPKSSDKLGGKLSRQRHE